MTERKVAIMNLRKLQQKDAEFMYEWMYDFDVTQYLHQDYSRFTIKDAQRFIKESDYLLDERHFAITNDEDEYIGTTSLRHIDKAVGLAELAIVVRKSAMQKGYAWFGLIETLNTAFDCYGLDKVYWRVNKKNERAIRFFMKHGLNMLDEDIPEEIKKRHNNEHNLVWFCVLKGDDYQNEAVSRGEVANCKVIKIKTIPTIEAGELSFFEGSNDIGFDIKRIYYISKVPEGVRRGFHAHRELKQILFCPYGRIQLLLENAGAREEITLSDPSIGVLINKLTWRETLWLQKDSVLVVACSDYYKPEDYIRNYNEYKLACDELRVK